MLHPYCSVSSSSTFHFFPICARSTGRATCCDIEYKYNNYILSQRIAKFLLPHSLNQDLLHSCPQETLPHLPFHSLLQSELALVHPITFIYI